jgi:flagellar biosynthesis protein FlgN
MADHAAFAAGLRAEHQTVREFCQVLEAEQASLLRSDVEALLQITQLKSSKVDRLADLANARVAHLDALRLDPGRRGMTEWLSRHAGADAPELSKLWDELVGFADKARSLNNSNGTLITTRLTHNQAALAALQSAARTSNLYGPDGQSSVMAGNRELGRA